MKPSREPLLRDLISQITAGDTRSASRLIRLIDEENPLAREALKKLFAHAGHAMVVGITGPPGAGKSTLTDCLIEKARAAELNVGVLAVDPSSPISGGAILGDRIRMNRFALDKKVFVRSLASRGHFGGITPATRGAIRVMDAMGKDIIFVETVGVGQDEVDIARLAHTTIVVAVPGLGDDIQAMKAGILEVADLFVVNKADHPDADKTVQYLKNIFRRTPTGMWVPPIVKTQALHHRGIDELWDAIRQHSEYRESGSKAYSDQHFANCRRELRSFLQESLEIALREKLHSAPEMNCVIEEIAEGKTDIYVAAEKILGDLGLSLRADDTSQRDKQTDY